MFGAIKAGYKMLYLSPRNSVAGHINVLEKVDCETFLVAKGARIDHITSARPMRTFVVSELSSFLDHALVPPYPYDKTFAEARSDPCLVLHTTGSTGLPKPITWKLDILSTYEAWRTIPAIDGYLPTTEVYQQARRIYNAMPLFHTSGLNIGITMSLVLGVTSVFGAANVMPHAAYADAIHRHGNVDASAGPPSIYEDLSTDVASVETLSRLQYILVCGAPLSQAVGDALSEHTRVISNFGATETACLPRLAPAIRDWSYFYWHPSHSGIELREAMDGLYELFLVKDEKLRNYQGVFSTFAHLDEYSMNDLYSRHPDPAKAFLYRWCSRADDVIVLSNGEKLAPALMEAGLRSSSLVRGAMVVGSGQFQPAALIDLDGPLPTSLWQREKIMRELLPAIEQANRHAPAHGKLDEHHLLFVEASKPMQYLGQGKIQRRESYKLYKSDIEMLYEDAGENLEAVTSSTEVVDFRNRAVLAAWLPELIRKIAPELPAVRNEDWLFEKGLDSLHVLRMVRKIKSLAKIGGFEQLAGSMQPRSVYANPSISKLVSFLHGHAQKDKICVMQDVSDSAYGSSLSEDSESDNEQNEERNLGYMQSLLDKYIQLLPTDGSNTRPLAPVSQRMTILLTGSTGSLGSYVLNQLLCDPTVERIVCLDRSPRAREIYGQNAQRRGFAETLPSRVEFHKADLSLVRLGLESHVYERIAATVTHVFHCQWPVNFNWTLPSFEPYIAGVRNLIDLAHSATHDAFVMFISSVAAVGGWRKGAVPEGPIWDLSASAPTGYGQSKLIAECLLDEATRASGVRSAICRVGIVAGPVEREEGLWNVHEYIPSVSTTHDDPQCL
jgi:acyl-CoA synthetase (AMP-forming)/AMP-acid ligase II